MKAMAHVPQFFLSGRTDFGSPSTEISQARSLFSKHHSAIDLIVTDPNAVGLHLPKLRTFLGEEEKTPYRASARGLVSARKAIAEGLCARKSVHTNDLLLTASTSEAFSYIIHALCDPGDSILVPRPGYPLFEQLAQLASVHIEYYEMAYDGAWHLELASLPSAQQIQEKKIRTLFAVSPHNPTGHILSENELTALRQTGLPLIIDEVFRGYLSPTSHELPPDPLRDAPSSPLTIIVDGLSKRSAAPALKLGWMLAQGRNSHEFLRRVEWISDTFLSVAGPIQEALPKIFALEQESQSLVNQRLRLNREHLERALQDCALSLLPCVGGWLAIFRLPNNRSEYEWSLLLAEQGIWLHPGHLYGLPFPCSFVASLLTPPGTLREGLLRIQDVVQRSTS